MGKSNIVHVGLQRLVRPKAFVWTPVSLKAIWGNDFVSKAQARSIISNSGGYLKLSLSSLKCPAEWCTHSHK